MSPPQVNLAVKEQPVVTDEELPMEKKETTEMPVIVTVETEKIRVQRANFQARRRRRRVCCVALIAVVLVVAAAATVIGVRHHRHHGRHHHHRHHERYNWNCDYGRDRINENVQVDHNNELIFVHHNQGMHNQPALHILHEYRRRMAAYKDLDHNICYITRLDETFDEGYERWERYEHTGRDPKTLRVFDRSAVETLVLQHVTDSHIYVHCHNSVSYWAVEIDEEEVTTTMTTVRV